MTSYVKNILAVYASASDADHNAGRAWYDDAHASARAIADDYGLPLHIVAGVIAALSPTNKWSRNLVDAANMCAVFTAGGYETDVTVCTYKTMRAKAWGILVACGDYAATLKALKGPKISDFYRCIMLDRSACCIDGHAWCIAHNDRRTMQEVPNIGVKARKALQAAYADAGSAVGAPAYVMQAVTWCAWRTQWGIK